MSIKLIGAGYGRTGTKSLQLALEQLGFGKCYHMEELLSNPKGVQFWEDADNNKDVDWGKLFEPGSYQSIVDFPGSIHYKKLYEYYPEAKVILTVRDPEKWYKSAYSTIYSFDPGISLKLKLLFSLPFSSIARHLFRVVKLIDRSIWQLFFEGKFEDKDYAINHFKKHLEDVKNRIPADKLLIFEVKDGWEPLCEFLNVPVPNEPFPSSNKQTDFHMLAKQVVRKTLN